jgi:hypothetical protein
MMDTERGFNIWMRVDTSGAFNSSGIWENIGISSGTFVWVLSKFLP